MRSSGACLLAFHSLIASTLAFSPFVRRFDEPVWTPARQTGAPGDEQLDEEGWSPRPTDSPQPDFGELDLFKRASFSLGTDTCGFVSGYSCMSTILLCDLAGPVDRWRRHVGLDQHTSQHMALILIPATIADACLSLQLPRSPA